MGDGRERSQAAGRGSVVNDDIDAGPDALAPGKRTLTEQLPVGGLTVQRATDPASQPAAGPKKPSISGTIVEGGPLSGADVEAVNDAAKKVPTRFRRYIAYGSVIKVGGSLAWRANNPGNLRDADSKIGSVHGAVGMFAVFASMAAGRAAQRALYVNKYGGMSVRDAIGKLTPPSENDTAKYLSQLAGAGVDLDKDVASQIDVLMSAVEANEGMIAGVEVPRSQ